MTDPTETAADWSPEVLALREAAWLVLDDMGEAGQSCCGLAKARLRVAFEPFMVDPDGEGEQSPMDYPLEVAQRVIAECGG